MKKILLIVVILFQSQIVYAGSDIYLKSGSKVSGSIVEKNDMFLKVDIGSGIPVTYFLDEIEAIEEISADNDIEISDQQLGNKFDIFSENSISDAGDGLDEDLQVNEEIVRVDIENFILEGTLLIPQSSQKMPVALIIAGSGPTDRNGNNPMMLNNSLKMLAEKLSENNIASLRYDKRGVAASASLTADEKDLRFEDFISDAVQLVEYLKSRNEFSEYIVIGHSEGSLIGMICAQLTNADKYISIAGPALRADKSIKIQLEDQPPEVLSAALPILEKLVEGELVLNSPPMLDALFRLSVQPYLISWFKYDPSLEIKKLNIPVLIAQGTTDLQIGVEDAKLLKQAKPEAEIIIVEGMNHVLKNSPMDREMNISIYNRPDIPLNEEFVQKIVDFITLH